MSAISWVAVREWRDTLYSRWLIGFGLLFAGLTLAISYFGLAGAREVGFQGFELVAASLLNLVLVSVPLVALVQASLNWAMEGDGLTILLTQPVARTRIMLGKYAGGVAAMLTTLLGGLLLGGLVVLAQVGWERVWHFALLMGLTALLIGLFAALGMGVALHWRDRTKALGVGLMLWFCWVLLYDLVIFGLTVAGAGVPLRVLLVAALIGNPVEAVRVCYLLATGSSGFVGATGAVLSETLGHAGGMAFLVGILVAWIGVGLMVARRHLLRKDF